MFVSYFYFFYSYFVYLHFFQFLCIYLFSFYFLFQKDSSFFNMFYNENIFLKVFPCQWVPIGYQRVEKTITMHFRKWNAHAYRHYIFRNALHHFMLWAPPLLSMSLRIIKLSVEVQLFCFGNPLIKL